MKYLLALAAGLIFLAWDIAKNDGAWIGYAVAEIDRAVYSLGF